MTATDARPVRKALRSALTAAMAQRDRSAMAVYRTALSAIDNAEAVPLGEEHRAGAIESSAAGVGCSEVERRSLTHEDEISLVKREIHERQVTAELLASTNRDGAQRLRADANLLQALLDGLAAED
jgi:uncharacterized protein YqeY